MRDMDLTAGVQRRVLPNGLTVLVERNGSAPVVAAVTRVAAGYYDEPDEWVGISHVLEHMYFKGTQRRAVGDLARETQRLGGYLNAGTIYEKTVYYTVLPAADESLERALDLQADALMHTALQADEFSRELEVIIQESKRKLDSPAAVAGETLFELLFAQHRMRRWRIGTEEGLRRLTVEDLQTYYRTRYTPDRTIVALVGDLDVDHALELAAETYGAWRTGLPHDDTAPTETDSPPPSLRVMRGDVERPVAVVGWRTVDVLHPDAAALDLAAAVLGSGRGSWLSRAVRAPGLASSARATHYANSELGVFQLTFDSDDESVDRAVEVGNALVAQLGAAGGGGPDAGDIERARSLMWMQWSRRLESMDGRATLWADCEALGGLSLANRFYRQVSDVTADEVRAAAEKHLRPQDPSAVLYGGNGLHTRLEEAEWPPPPPPPPPAKSPIATSLASVTPPEIASRSVSASRTAGVDEIGEVTHRALPGADLLVRPKRGAGLVFVGAYVLGLRAKESSQTAGVSALLVRTAVRGAAGLTSEQIALGAEMLGGTVVPSVSLDVVGWGITVRAAALAEAAELLCRVALEATLEREDLRVERALQASDAARQRDDMYGYPIRQVLGQSFPDSAYGLPILGDPEGVNRLDDVLVQEWASQLRSRRMTVVAVGDLEAQAMLDCLGGAFERWPGSAVDHHHERLNVKWDSGRGREKRDKSQSAIAMAFRTSPYGSPDRFPLIVTGSLLTGLAGRLFEELRERRSLAYTVSAMPWLKRDAGAVLAYITTSPEREEEARSAMLEELAAAGAKPIPESEIERARNYAAGALQLRLQSAHAVAGEILEAWTHGGLSSLPSLAADLRSVTSDDVRRVAGDVFGGGRRIARNTSLKDGRTVGR